MQGWSEETRKAVVSGLEGPALERERGMQTVQFGDDFIVEVRLGVRVRVRAKG